MITYLLRIVNPLNRTPETEETMVMGCHCVCNSGHQGTYNLAWLPIVPNCQCNCIEGADTNYTYNYNGASDAA